MAAEQPQVQETPEDRRIREAVARGKREQLVDSRLDGHDSEIRSLRSGMRAVTEEMSAVKTGLTELTDAVERREEISKILAENAEKLASKQLSTKNFYVGVGLVVTSMVSTILAVVH